MSTDSITIRHSSQKRETQDLYGQARAHRQQSTRLADLGAEKSREAERLRSESTALLRKASSTWIWSKECGLFGRKCREKGEQISLQAVESSARAQGFYQAAEDANKKADQVTQEAISRQRK